MCVIAFCWSLFNEKMLKVEALLEETPLLVPDKLRALYERFLSQTRADVSMWMAKSLEREKDVCF